jgi:phosphatidate cytidylyltransferase
MLIRFISGIVCTVLVVLVVLSEKIMTNITVSLVSILSLFEVYKAVNLGKYRVHQLFGIFMAVCFNFSDLIGETNVLSVITIYIFILFVYYLINHKSTNLNELSKMFFVTVYISYFFSHIVFVRKMPDGQFLVWLVLIGAYITDTFAYLFGILFGKHKLCPQISPKKTMEGAVAGVIGCVTGYVIFGFIMQNFFEYYVNFAGLILLGFIASIAAQIGDLHASVIKRQYNLKDFGTLIPGHGGMFDRTDSLLFVAPVVYICLSYFNIPVIWN